MVVIFIYKQAKQAYIYYIYTQKIHIRKKQRYTAEGFAPSCQSIYEWQPQGSKHWYPIHRNNIISISHYQPKRMPLHYQHVRNFWNQMLMHCTVETTAVYHRSTKALIVDVDGLEVLASKEVK